MNAEQVSQAIKSAVSDATLSVTLAGHMTQCEKDKAEMKAEQARMHAENTKKFDQLFKVVWIAMGIGAALSIGGKEILAKFVGG